MEDLVSVIIPIYNVEKYLDKCIKSVIEQTYKNLEIVLIDDGSPDNCPKICDDWAKKDKRIKVIHKTNGGLSDARNIGIGNAKGKYLLFVDSDDYIENNMIYELHENAKQNNIDIVASGFIYETDNEQTKYYDKSNYIENSEQILERIFNNNDISTAIWDKLYKRDLFNNIMFPVGKIHEDMAVLYKLIDKSNKVMHIDKAYYHYVQRDDSIIYAKFNKKKLSIIEFKEDILKFVEKKYPKLIKDAERFFIQELNRCINLCYKNNLREEYINLREKLKSYMRRIIKNEKLSLRTKMKSIIIVFGGSKFLSK